MNIKEEGFGVVLFFIHYRLIIKVPISELYAGRDVYFYCWIVDNNWVRMKAVDANNFNDEIFDYSVSTKGWGITKTNNNFNRQITLCTNGSFTNGAYLLNGEFSQASIYKTNGTYSNTNSNNTISNRRGKFGLVNTNLREKVTVNDYHPWDYENISIRFN